MIEEMSDFFVARLDGYDAHMLQDIPGLAAGYEELARQLPANTQQLLDLGCGTGLELGPIFARCPDVRVTGIDLTQPMLDQLREKFADQPIQLICANYLEQDLGVASFDAAISFESLHHLLPAEKLALYRRVYQSLQPGGRFVEGDYMVATPAEEAFWLAESARLRSEQRSAHWPAASASAPSASPAPTTTQSASASAPAASPVPTGGPQLYHIDIPCTVDRQIALLEQAGFRSVRQVWRQGDTSIIVADK
ncbi:MAG: class I SAM-dependent methyltransferase [Actinomycetia bacterium]|nr:class I SAM-dependent methyltransferase [Actinomycetes bacterium]